MGADRAELAAARAAAAGLRVEQLRRRLARLRSGEVSTPEDVVLATVSAESQRAEAVRARERLHRAYAGAEALRRGWPGSSPPPGQPPAAVPVGGPGTGREAAGAEVRELRQALVSMGSAGDTRGGWSRERRQQLWQALTEQCGQESWQGWSRAVCVAAAALLPEVRGVALSGYDDQGAPHLLAVSDEWTRRAEEVVQLVGEGPAVEAYRSRAPVLVSDLEAQQSRWPAYVLTAHDTGLTTVYALPVQLDGVVLGSLTLYPRHQDGTAWSGWTDGGYVATVAAKALLADLDAVEQGRPLGGFDDDRVQMATGVLSVRLDVPVAEASVRLRAFAFSNALGLGEVAQGVLDGSLRMT